MAVTLETGNTFTLKGGVGVNDNDAVFARTGSSNGETGDVSQYDTFELFSTAGAMDVFVTLDGVNYATVGFGLTNQTSVDPTPVLVTTAGQMFGFRGKFRNIKVLQNGATAVANATLTCGVMGIRS